MSDGYIYNDEFISEDPKVVAGFYDHFSSREDLIAWMTERPEGRRDLVEVPGDPKIVVVIPTTNARGSLAAHCRAMFSGHHILFVDSQGRDPLFNLARSVNFGVKSALQLNPDWIVVTGDDVIEVDPFAVLAGALGDLNPHKTSLVIPVPFSSYHSVESSLVKFRFWAPQILGLRSRTMFRFYQIANKFGAKFQVVRNSDIGTGYRKLLSHLLVQTAMSFVDTVSFQVYSAQQILRQNGVLYDETYITESEESDLAIRLHTSGAGIHQVSFRVSEGVGTTLGISAARTLRSLASRAYMNSKIDRGLLKIPSVTAR